ncbi:MAG: hypothetical protein EOO45_19275 [Flavobacterium sp.]|nr:MAG: hypothetical protein EOO45_19275 [Flavobacterium sp.]
MKYLLLLFLITICSCKGREEINFEIHNDSLIDYDSIVITGLGKLKFDNIKSGCKTKGVLDYSRSKTKTDGGYEIKLYSNDSIKNHDFGYYSNGIPSSTHMIITIAKDTINVKEIYDN